MKNQKNNTFIEKVIELLKSNNYMSLKGVLLRLKLKTIFLDGIIVRRLGKLNKLLKQLLKLIFCFIQNNYFL